MSKLIKDKKLIERGLIKNEKTIAEIERTGIDKKEPMFSVQLPNIYKNPEGNWDFDGELRDFDTLAEFNAYAQENEEFYQFLKESYPIIISTIWRSAFSKMYGSETVAGKLLRGSTVDLDSIAIASTFNEHGFDEPTINYIITKVNGAKAKNNPATITPYRKAKKEIMSMLGADSKTGYFLPEITDKGAVVTATKNNRLCVRFFAVSDGEYTPEQVKEYLLANADAGFLTKAQNDSETESFVDSLIEKSRKAYSAMMRSDIPGLQSAVESMNVDCSYIYRPDFSLIEQKETGKRTFYLEDEEFDISPAPFDDDFGSSSVDEDFSTAVKPKVEPNKKKVPELSEIIVEGNTNTKTNYDSQKGKVILVLTNDGGLHYETNFENEGKTLRVSPVEATPVQNEKQ